MPRRFHRGAVLFVFLTGLLLSLPALAFAEVAGTVAAVPDADTISFATFTGTVTAVKDGDTIVVLDDRNRPVKVRLEGIDAPEFKQPYGRAAKKYASSLAFGKTVTVTGTGTDRYGRVLGDVILPDGRSLQEEMLKAGLAWHYKHFNSSQRLADLETEAREAGRGLWADLNPTPPWEFRHDKKLEKNKTYRHREYHPRRR